MREHAKHKDNLKKTQGLFCLKVDQLLKARVVHCCSLEPCFSGADIKNVVMITFLLIAGQEDFHLVIMLY